MITQRVSSDCWANCYNQTYNDKGSRLGGKTRKYLYDTYGIEHWSRNNVDEYLLEFTCEKKMIYWSLRWV